MRVSLVIESNYKKFVLGFNGLKFLFLFVDGDVVRSLLEDMFKAEFPHTHNLTRKVGSPLDDCAAVVDGAAFENKNQFKVVRSRHAGVEVMQGGVSIS